MIKTDNLKLALKNVNTRQLLAEILAECGVFRPNIRTGEEAAYKEGKRAIGLNIINSLFTIDVEAFTLLHKEHFARCEREQVEREKDGGRE